MTQGTDDGCGGGRTQRFLAVAVIACVITAGCAPQLPKLNTGAPIEKRSAFLGTRYEQGGEVIDNDDMIAKLREQPGPGEQLSGYTFLATTSVLLAAIGGGLVGWPLGEAIAGKEDPLWALAAVGGGLIVVSIPFGIVASNKLENAVDAYNRQFGWQRGPLRAWTPQLTLASSQTCRETY
jgi:hypothetical protein